ncbi:hypothetical protein [Spirochaeta cellobiosiphila]|uniref:hypothetical protein n=1 Tax=Spirochaeta cellobiosiphila TaxID=504483 RepID=UPI00040F921F|nr:hypothetical protein [Spirochaeta cellobiosiphila]
MYQTFKYPKHNKLINGIGILLSLSMIVYTNIYTDSLYWPFKLGVSVVMAILAIVLTIRLFQLQAQYIIDDNRLSIKGLFFQKTILYKNIKSFVINPSAGVSYVNGQDTKIHISRNLKDFDILADNIERRMIENSGHKRFKAPFVINTERFSYFVFAFLIVLTSWFGYRMFLLLYNSERVIFALGFQSVVIIFIAYLLFRMVFMIPRQYVFLKEQIRIRYLLGETIFLVNKLDVIHKQVYYFRGARLSRYKLKFLTGKEFDIDELTIDRSLKDLQEFLRVQYQYSHFRPGVDG